MHTVLVVEGRSVGGDQTVEDGVQVAVEIRQPVGFDQLGDIDPEAVRRATTASR